VKEAKKQRRQKGLRSSTLSSLPMTQEPITSPIFAHFRYDIKAAGERVCFKTEQLKKISLQLIHTTWNIVQNKVVFYYKVKVRVF
jgi:hypothetical protein